MTGLQISGLICGCLALFFAFIAGLLYFKLKKLFYIIDEEQYEQLLPFIEKQRKKVYFSTSISALLSVATVVLSLVNTL